MVGPRDYQTHTRADVDYAGRRGTSIAVNLLAVPRVGIVGRGLGRGGQLFCDGLLSVCLYAKGIRRAV